MCRGINRSAFLLKEKKPGSCRLIFPSPLSLTPENGPGSEIPPQSPHPHLQLTQTSPHLQRLTALVGETLELGLVLHRLRHVGDHHRVRRGLRGEFLVEVGHVGLGGGGGRLELGLVLLGQDALKVVDREEATLLQLVRA